MNRFTTESERRPSPLPSRSVGSLQFDMLWVGLILLLAIIGSCSQAEVVERDFDSKLTSEPWWHGGEALYVDVNLTLADENPLGGIPFSLVDQPYMGSTDEAGLATIPVYPEFFGGSESFFGYGLAPGIVPILIWGPVRQLPTTITAQAERVDRDKLHKINPGESWEFDSESLSITSYASGPLDILAVHLDGLELAGLDFGAKEMFSGHISGGFLVEGVHDSPKIDGEKMILIEMNLEDCREVTPGSHVLLFADLTRLHDGLNHISLSEENLSKDGLGQERFSRLTYRDGLYALVCVDH